jgi:hypothetical protein
VNYKPSPGLGQFDRITRMNPMSSFPFYVILSDSIGIATYD